MTMEKNELNRKVLENVRNRIVVSNLESEENMKLNKRKQVLSVAAVMVIMLTGSFFTVNAATDGKVVEEIKKAITIKYDESKYNLNCIFYFFRYLSICCCIYCNKTSC